MGYERPSWVLVDLAAVAHNVCKLKSLLAPGVELMAVVKANGYGHGMLEVSRAVLAAGADRLGVALLEEGEHLRTAGIDARVQVLGELPEAAASRALGADLDLTTGRMEFIEAAAAAARATGRRARLHLKVDTGMNRIGCHPRDALALARGIAADEHLVLAGVMTHFASSEEPEGPGFQSQIRLWHDVRTELASAGVAPETWHAANSGATILVPESHHDMVRCGISVYGLHPGPATRGRIDLKPALGLHSRVSALKKCAAGESVSYGHTWTAERETTVATLPLGYGDGYTRRLSNLGWGVFGSSRLPIVGNITMDQTMVAVPDGLDLGVGDVVTLIGEGVTADDLAALLGTINYEITCMLGERLPRRYVGLASGDGDRT